MSPFGRISAQTFALFSGSDTTGQFLRFLIVGVVNTIVGCAVYLFFVQYMSHTLAYGIAFVIAIICAAPLHARVTFGVTLRRHSFALSALFYFISYLVNAGVLELTVRGFGVDKRLAILVIVAVSIPMTYIVNRLIFRGRS